jgi:hypothetical protein
MKLGVQAHRDVVVDGDEPLGAADANGFVRFWIASGDVF